MTGQAAGRQADRHIDSSQGTAANQNAQSLDMLSTSRYDVKVSALCRYQALGMQTHGDSGSPRTVVHQGQLAKGALVMVLKQQLLLISLGLRDLEVAALYYVEVVAFLSFPAHGQQLLDCIHSCVAQVRCKGSHVQQSAWLLANARTIQ